MIFGRLNWSARSRLLQGIISRDARPAPPPTRTGADHTLEAFIVVFLPSLKYMLLPERAIRWNPGARQHHL